MTMPFRHTLPALGRISLLTLALLVGAIGVHLFTYSKVEKNSDLDHQRHFNDSYKVFSLTLPNELSFCDVPVPMERLEASGTTSLTGKRRSARISSISRPTLPVAPTTATLKPIIVILWQASRAGMKARLGGLAARSRQQQ